VRREILLKKSKWGKYKPMTKNDVEKKENLWEEGKRTTMDKGNMGF